MSLLAPFTARVVRILIMANVAVFLWGLYLAQQRGLSTNDFLFPQNVPQAQEIAHETGAVSVSDVRPPSWGLVRLLTCCFVHFGLIHLGANMLSLYFIGPMLERMWGHWRFLVLYLIAGIGGSCAAMLYKPDIHGVPVTLAGASGAIWGIMASMAVWVILNRRYLPRRLLSSWSVNIIIVFVINIAITQSIPGISGEAHYGGGIIGAGCALLLHLTRFGPAAQRWLAAGLVATLPVVGLWLVTHPPQLKPEQQQPPAGTNPMSEVDRIAGEADHLVPDAKAEPIINTKNPRDPNDEVARRWIDRYKQAEEKLNKAVSMLEAEAATSEKHREKMDAIKERLRLYGLNRRCLEQGNAWTIQDEAERQEAIRQVEKRRERRSRFAITSPPAPARPSA